MDHISGFYVVDIVRGGQTAFMEGGPELEGKSQASETNSPTILAIASALMAGLGRPVPLAPLGPETVSLAVLSHPVGIATEMLVKHFKTCRNPTKCKFAPPPLHIYQKGSRPEAMRRHKPQVCRALWTHRDHEFVAMVRKATLEDQGSTQDAVETGALLEADRLVEVLRSPSTAQQVAGVLWAMEFKGPSAELLFRCLMAVIDHSPADTAPKGDGQATHEGDGLSDRVRGLDRSRKLAKRAADEAKDALDAKEKELRQVMHTLQDTQQQRSKVTDELEIARRRVSELEAALEAGNRNTVRVTRNRDELLRELRKVRDDQRILEVEQSKLAQQLSEERAQLRRTQLELASLPEGDDSVWDFLEDQRVELEEEALIVAGGDRQKVEQRLTLLRKLKDAFLNAYPSHRQARPIATGPREPLRLVTLGGGSEVGRSCYLLELGKYRILVDCGIKPGDSSVDLHPDLEQVDEINALILTHAHSDHVGWVPALVRKLGEIDIYCTDRTAALLPAVLEDCYHNYRRSQIKREEQARFSPSTDPVEDAYGLGEVQTVTKALTIGCQFDREERLPFGGIWLRFFRAGHILGAASVMVGDRSGPRALFSGDFSSTDQLTVSPADWPLDQPEIDLLVLESTYGDRNHKPIEESREELLAFLREVTERGGSVVIASFALGRAQELLKLILTAQESGRLSPDLPVHADGLIRKINPTYKRFGAFYYEAGAFDEVSGEADRADIISQAKIRPRIIVTTSGMLAGGPAVAYAQHLLPDPRHRIVFVGFQDEGAPSKALLDLNQPGLSRTVTVLDENGEKVVFKAAMPAKHVSMSSHADQAGLLAYAAKMRPRHIALVHGEPKAQLELKSRLLLSNPRAEVYCGPPNLLIP